MSGVASGQFCFNLCSCKCETTIAWLASFEVQVPETGNVIIRPNESQSKTRNSLAINCAASARFYFNWNWYEAEIRFSVCGWAQKLHKVQICAMHRGEVFVALCRFAAAQSFPLVRNFLLTSTMSGAKLRLRRRRIALIKFQNFENYDWVNFNWSEELFSHRSSEVCLLLESVWKLRDPNRKFTFSSNSKDGKRRKFLAIHGKLHPIPWQQHRAGIVTQLTDSPPTSGSIPSSMSYIQNDNGASHKCFSTRNLLDLNLRCIAFRCL